MTEDKEYYNRLAKHCREQAALLHGEAAAPWVALAENYEKLANLAAGGSQFKQGDEK